MFEIRWERRLHQAGTDSGISVATGGEVVLHERRTRLVCLDPMTGARRWDVPVGTWPRALTIAEERCFALPQNASRLLCFDLETGDRVWSTELDSTTGHLVVSGDALLAGGWRGYTPLRLMDRETGELRWRTADRSHTARPIAADGGVLVGEPGGSAVRLLDRRDGAEIAAWPLPHPLIDTDNKATFTSAGNDRFLTRCGLHSVVDIRPSQGTVRECLVAHHDLASSAPVHVGGLLWLRERRGGFTVADLVDERVRYRVDVGQPLLDHVVAVDSGFVVASTTGTLFHLDSEGTVTERVTVSRRIRALRPHTDGQVLVAAKGTLLAIKVGPRRE
ncbi:PQQ-binding-like beta-propeller repeat protein [Saccharomonospora sp. NPDC006951]